MLKKFSSLTSNVGPLLNENKLYTNSTEILIPREAICLPKNEADFGLVDRPKIPTTTIDHHFISVFMVILLRETCGFGPCMFIQYEI